MQPELNLEISWTPENSLNTSFHKRLTWAEAFPQHYKFIEKKTKFSQHYFFFFNSLILGSDRHDVRAGTGYRCIVKVLVP